MISVAIQGGAMRSIYCLGAVRALSESRYFSEITSMYTASAGCVSAAVLANLLAATDPLSVEQISKELVSRLAGPRFIDERRLYKIVDVDYLVDVISEVTPVTPDSLRAKSMHFEVALTDAHSGKAAYVNLEECRSDDEVNSALRATMAVPALYPHHALINGSRYVDGGISDPLPALRALRRRPKILVAITSVPHEMLALPVTSKEARIIKFIPGIPPVIRRMLLVRNPLADAVDDLLMLDSVSSVKIIRISPSDSSMLGSRLETNKEKLLALQELGYRDGLSALQAFEDAAIGAA